MTDIEKLQKIEEICKEAFNNDSDDKNKAIMHKAQALCDIYALFLYDGATLPQIEEKKQVNLFDLIGE